MVSIVSINFVCTLLILSLLITFLTLKTEKTERDDDNRKMVTSSIFTCA